MTVERGERHRGPVRVLIADDHQVVREGLRMILGEERETIEIVGEAADGHEAVREAERLKPDVVLMDLLMPGAAGYLLKDVLRAQLVQAIHAAALGVPTLDPRAQQHLMRQVASPPAASPFAGLTPRELDVLRLVARGMGNKQIAAQLHLSVGTVKGYVSAILPKINAGDRTQAALFAVKHGLEDGPA
jgi:NarL family two-component system response regulator LiaR